jgi:hypothetical protein
MVGAAEAEAGLQFAAADIAGEKKQGPKRFVHGSSSMVHGPVLFFAALYRQKALP